METRTVDNKQMMDRKLNFIRQPSRELQAEVVKTLRTKAFASDVQRLIKGFAGERQFDEIYSTFAQDSWDYLTDFHFELGTLTQLDAILITPGHIHVYEVKNYPAYCQVQNDIFSYNGQPLASNPFNQVRAIKSRFNSLLSLIGYQGQATYHLVMINKDCYFKDRDQFSDVLMRNELKLHFQSLQGASYKKNPSNLLEKIKRFETDNPYHKNYAFDYRDFPPGILCYKCGSLDTYPSYKQIKCRDCGHARSKTQALQNLIGELSILDQNTPIRTHDIHQYSGGLLSKRFIMDRISHLLNKKLPKARHYVPSTKMYNFSALYKIIHDKFNIY
ncbi:nuclease-related domain-containing protein [Alloiococcus otitis]|uniref:nuclease-related domain-containing protein n=1 Tax=Alloiococcus otitis TaxID=1652 RepID=UPI00235778F3|nr:nuclease-related domain-containing protein [Alloiococcus otitis]